MLPKILLVEDEELLREINSTKLEMEGFTFQVAHNGKEALKILKKFDADIILLDMLMPVMSGIEFLRALNKRPGSHPAVIILSNISSPESTREAMQLGARQYLNKSRYTPAEVTSYVKDFWQQEKKAAA